MGIHMTDAAAQLSSEEREIVRRCLNAAVNGPFFPDWEFHALFGLTRAEVAAVLLAWPDSDHAGVQDIAVANSINNLLGYPHDDDASWNQYVGLPREVVARLRTTWARTH
jgi:hypothetical protein